IQDKLVTGVQTCAFRSFHRFAARGARESLGTSLAMDRNEESAGVPFAVRILPGRLPDQMPARHVAHPVSADADDAAAIGSGAFRSEERRVGEVCSCGWS